MNGSASNAPSAGVLELVRPDLRGFGGYKSARTEALRGDVWLNANESAWANPADADAVCRRYPEPQPAALRAANEFGKAAETSGPSLCIATCFRGFSEFVRPAVGRPPQAALTQSNFVLLRASVSPVNTVPP